MTLLAAPLAYIAAQESSVDDIRLLDDEVQEAKDDVLDVANELNMLEKRLLYPSGTRLTVSLAMARNNGITLSAVEVRIDGRPMAQHIYSAPELEALRRGGVQNLFTGNIATGRHDLSVKIIGELGEGTFFEATEHHAFAKGADARSIDITLHPAGREDNGIRIKDR